MNKKIRQELEELASNWNASGEHDDTEFAGRCFVNDFDLDEFAMRHDLTQADYDSNYDKQRIEAVCDCRIIDDYEGKNPYALFGDVEIVFNPVYTNYRVEKRDTDGCWVILLDLDPADDFQYIIASFARLMLCVNTPESFRLTSFDEETNNLIIHEKS